MRALFGLLSFLSCVSMVACATTKAAKPAGESAPKMAAEAEKSAAAEATAKTTDATAAPAPAAPPANAEVTASNAAIEKVPVKVECPPGFDGTVKTSVMFWPGSNLEGGPKVVPQHLTYLKERMTAGEIQSAGPVLAHGKIAGRAFAVFNSSDTEKVKALVEADPMVREKVLTYQTQAWLQCSLSPTKAKKKK